MAGADLCYVHVRGARGNRSLYSDEVADTLVRLLEDGNFRAVAAAAAGIAPRTFQEWMERGRAGEEPYAGLLVRVAEAEAKAEAGYVQAIALAAGTDWRAAAWYLERARPELWGPPAKPRAEPAKSKPEEPKRAEPPDVFTEIDELAKRRVRR